MCEAVLLLCGICCQTVEREATMPFQATFHDGSFITGYVCPSCVIAARFGQRVRNFEVKPSMDAVRLQLLDTYNQNPRRHCDATPYLDATNLTRITFRLRETQEILAELTPVSEDRWIVFLDDTAYAKLGPTPYLNDYDHYRFDEVIRLIELAAADYLFITAFHQKEGAAL